MWMATLSREMYHWTPPWPTYVYDCFTWTEKKLNGQFLILMSLSRTRYNKSHECGIHFYNPQACYQNDKIRKRMISLGGLYVGSCPLIKPTDCQQGEPCGIPGWRGTQPLKAGKLWTACNFYQRGSFRPFAFALVSLYIKPFVATFTRTHFCEQKKYAEYYAASVITYWKHVCVCVLIFNLHFRNDWFTFVVYNHESILWGFFMYFKYPS